MDQKHTPSPWFAVEYSGYHNLHDSDQYGATNILDEDECAKAPHNAKLAAAAPELLEALQYCVSVWEGLGPHTEPWLVSAKAAINKALQ